MMESNEKASWVWLSLESYHSCTVVIPELLDDRWAGVGICIFRDTGAQIEFKKYYIFCRVGQLYGDILANPEGCQYLFHAQL